jgi:hypothetical protein
MGGARCGLSQGRPLRALAATSRRRSAIFFQVPDLSALVRGCSASQFPVVELDQELPSSFQAEASKHHVAKESIAARAL